MIHNCAKHPSTIICQPTNHNTPITSEDMTWPAPMLLAKSWLPYDPTKLRCPGVPKGWMLILGSLLAGLAAMETAALPANTACGVGSATQEHRPEVAESQQ